MPEHGRMGSDTDTLHQEVADKLQGREGSKEEGACLPKGVKGWSSFKSISDTVSGSKDPTIGITLFSYDLLFEELEEGMKQYPLEKEVGSNSTTSNSGDPLAKKLQSGLAGMLRAAWAKWAE